MAELLEPLRSSRPQLKGWTLALAMASCIAAFVVILRQPPQELLLAALCVPIFWLGVGCPVTCGALQLDRPSLFNIFPALLGSFGVLLMLWSALVAAYAAASILLRTVHS